MSDDVTRNNENVDNFSQTNSPRPANNEFSSNFISTNARYLRPKITSLIDAFENLDLTFAAITETWLSDGTRLQLDCENLLLGHGLGCITKKRPPGNAGYSHCGVALIYRNDIVKAEIFAFPNPENFEVLPVKLSIKGIKRKVFVACIYIPPGYSTARGKGCTGDFNQWKIELAFEDYPDIAENYGGPTRGDRTIDRNFTNWHDQITSKETLPQLETELLDSVVRKSDHNIVLTRSSLIKIPPPNWVTFSVRSFSEEGATGFKNWLEETDWVDVFRSHGSNAKVRGFQAVLDEGMNRFFPEKTIRRKDNDLPWFNHVARKKVKKKESGIQI